MFSLAEMGALPMPRQPLFQKAAVAGEIDLTTTDYALAHDLYTLVDEASLVFL